MSITLKSIISSVSEKETHRVNPILFNRNANGKISDYIINGYKSLEALPYIHLVSTELITDESKIDIKLNRNHLKNPLIKKDKTIEKLVPIDKTAYELLKAKFVIDYDGDYRYINKNLLLPAYIDNYHLFINNNEILPINQLVDISTYNKKNKLRLKTTLTPIEIYKELYKVKFETTTGKEFEPKAYKLNLFSKQLNPLVYYVAYFGVTGMINYFNMTGIVDVTTKEYNTDINYYFAVSKKLFVEVDKQLFKVNDFVQQFTFLLCNLFNKRTDVIDLDNLDYWTSRLGALFVSNSKNYLSKGKNVLISFSRVLDDTTKLYLRLNKRNLTSTYALIRWEMQNFPELKRKNNYIMRDKRIRCNEGLAFCFIRHMSSRLNQLLNKKKLTIESIEKIFAYNEDELFKLLIFSKHPCTLLRYNVDVNDFQAINALRVTMTGPQGLNNLRQIPMEARDIYPDQLGKIDLNSNSHGLSTGLTYMLCPTVQVDNQGFFLDGLIDPDNFINNLINMKSIYNDKKINKIKEDINQLKMIDQDEIKRLINIHSLLGDDGYYHIPKRIKIIKNKDDNRIIINNDHIIYTNEKGLYMTESNRYIIPKTFKPKKSDDGYYHIKPSNLIPSFKRPIIYPRIKKPKMKNGRIIIYK